MKIAVIGFGYWGEKLIKSLIRFKGLIDYLCIVDIDNKKRFKARQFANNFFTDINLALSRVDAVVIATWENTHYKLVKKCLLAKKHVLVEKPLATNYEDATELVFLAKKNKLSLMVDNTFLFDKSFLWLKKRLNKNSSDKLQRIDSFRFSKNIIKPYTNVIIDLLPHDISIFYSLINKLALNMNIETDIIKNNDIDNAMISLNFGLVKTRSFLSWTAPFSRREMIFYTTKGIYHWEKRDKQEDIIKYFHYKIKNKLILKEKNIIKNKNQTLNTVLNEFFNSCQKNMTQMKDNNRILSEVKMLENVLVRCIRKK